MTATLERARSQAAAEEAPDLGPRGSSAPALQPTLERAVASGPRRRPRCRIRRRMRSTASRAAQRRAEPLGLPELNEPEVIRHFVNLSQLNYCVDTGFYPLGSCTMKYNPKINEWAARLPGFAALHPLAPDAVAQGTLELLWELEQWLARDQRHEGRDAPAGRRRARRADRHPDDPRLPRCRAATRSAPR